VESLSKAFSPGGLKMDNKNEPQWEPVLREKIQPGFLQWRNITRDKECDFEKTCFNQGQCNPQQSRTLDTTAEAAVTFVNKKRDLTHLKNIYTITMWNATEVRKNA
jgi:hypothetical protein